MIPQSLPVSGVAAGRHVSNAAPAQAPKRMTNANSISDLLDDPLVITFCRRAESDISAPARMA